MSMRSFRILSCFVLIATVLGYDLGTTNTYHYETTVVVNEDCGDNANDGPTGYTINAKMQLSPIWRDSQDPQKKLYKIQVSQPQLLVSRKSGFEKRKSDLEKIPTLDSFFLFNNNKVEKFWDSSNEHTILRNLKRSVASFLQVKRKNGVEQLEDVSGKCEVMFKVEGKTIRRSKRSCTHPVKDSILSQPAGVRSSSVEHHTIIDCDMQDDVSDIVSQCIINEQVKTYSNPWKKASVCVHATSRFIFESTSENKHVFKNTDYSKVLEEIKQKDKLIEDSLMAVHKNENQKTVSNLVDSIKGFQESLKTTNLAKLKSASAFFKLLPLFQLAAKDDILKVLELKKYEPILPQILDLVAASATESSVDAALTFFGKIKEYDEKLERYLISLSVIPSPETFVLKEIKAFLEKGGHDEKIEATLITTLGSLMRNYAKNEKAESAFVENILDYFEDSLKKCKSDACILSYLRGLRNAAQRKSLPLLLQYALKGGKISMEALFAIRNLPSSPLSTESQQLLQKVFHQVGAMQDRSSRAIAVEILLNGNSNDDIVRSILRSLSDQSDEEFTTFIVSKILGIMEHNKVLRSQISRILQEKEVAHYYSLAQKGESSLFNRQLMSTDGLNVTYGIEMELLQGGLLKRSSFDVEFVTQNYISNLLSVGIFASGMASFAGGESSSSDGDSPLAGMELTLLGTSLRPYIFFSSTSELMGHAWSGTASEPTPALQGIFSLSNDNQVVVLHNGIIAKIELRGVMSTDMSGAIQISLWGRNSQSQVNNAAALLMKGSAVVDAEFVKARGEYLYHGNSAINFNTDLDFAEAPFKMCLEMQHPDVKLKHDFQRSVEVTETKFSLKKTKKRKRFIPSRSYALHQNNNELCRLMKSSEGF